jgi:hypothetical protein
MVLNPVRAGMVRDAGDWPWSSYRAMVGEEPAPPWLETDWLLGQFGEERPRAQASYAAFVRQGMGKPSVWEGLRHQVFLGSEAFVDRHCARIKGPSDCARFRAPSAGHSPSPSRILLTVIPSGMRRWRGPFKLVPIRCRRSPTSSAYTTPP